jgi:hypothetical protein
VDFYATGDTQYLEKIPSTRRKTSQGATGCSNARSICCVMVFQIQLQAAPCGIGLCKGLFENEQVPTKEGVFARLRQLL